jgi:hypothetical protein
VRDAGGALAFEGVRVAFPAAGFDDVFFPAALAAVPFGPGVLAAALFATAFAVFFVTAFAVCSLVFFRET